ncbi:16S rRNA (guanine(966)-N(2))-methyltransferase RsmD [Acidipila rosea]|uniref:16S rRNA (Guanine(966)-N(2))-methyltransferase RsmD n=1 Tax=Acidipila rosea TaxID=768535 RepID=A0A4R1L6A3_9BACT|nr:16S rRNA (guanine(966)-N(2))-methyltransferase RsmD [Acidipila rosea]MBW4026488.1 16S rRNA (guanine(966)-N(2))-methyltransferase RsmD [Acidobacteriota bacterium]MBW4044376.1 16S rRNA (guanine(966)-N(2))-methyltransferase RsmD [Acidobacteriota bacterium]TCK72553.1 16S rRNA (guanine(966)-N(2))-methyltransferase RsmD [Acidipila rosea]
MRIIAGEFRSRRLVAPRGMATRPTSDRLRETLFNVLGSAVEGANFADLYAGSGAVGIEALSRGARSVLFVDEAEAAVRAIRENLTSLQVRQGFTIEQRSVASALRRLAERGGAAWQVVVLDPPYAMAKEYEQTLGLLGELNEKLLQGGAVVVAEHEKRSSLGESFGPLRRTRVLTQGDAALSFYRIDSPTRPAPG